MPEIIDGVSYETTPVIPASPNTVAGGARPFPSAASPGKAFWQLLKRYAQELDKFESTVIRTLTDRVVAAENAVSATSLQRRALVQTTAVSLAERLTTVTPIPWVSDTICGDVVPAAGKGIQVSNAQITFNDAGNYLITVSDMKVISNILMGINVGGKHVARAHANATALDLTMTANVRVAAGTTAYVWGWNNNNRGGTDTIPGYVIANDDGAVPTASTATNVRPTLSIVRLGA